MLDDASETFSLQEFRRLQDVLSDPRYAIRPGAIIVTEGGIVRMLTLAWEEYRRLSPRRRYLLLHGGDTGHAPMWHGRHGHPHRNKRTRHHGRRA